MADISICTNKECDLAKKCLRQNVKPSNINQSYTFFDKKKDVNCEFFIEIKNRFERPL